MTKKLQIPTKSLLIDVTTLIDRAKTKVTQQVNSSLVLLYWQIGHRIHQEILNEERGGYGEKVVKQLANELNTRYGRGFNAASLFRMVRFARFFPEKEIVATLSRLLSWSHFIELSGLEDALKRSFYTEMCRLEHWSVRELRKKLNGMLYERTAISHQPETVIQKDLKTLQKNNELSRELVFRDPYILNFLELPTQYSESNLEDAIIDELSKFFA